MKILAFKPLLLFLIQSFIVIAFFISESSFAYGRRYSKHYGHHGYRHYGHSRHYGRRYYGGYRYYPGKYYRRKHYYNPRRSYSYYPKSYSVPIYTQFNNNDAYQQSGLQRSGVNSSAWLNLKQGQYSQALVAFANAAQSNPNSGVPKAGYALATASGGDLGRGIWAMRRAFRIDPASLHYLQLDGQGQVLIDNLITQYSSQASQTNAGQAFMISALYYLKHDYAAAKKSLTSAEQHGDKSPSYTNLQRLINRQIEDEGKNDVK